MCRVVAEITRLVHLSSDLTVSPPLSVPLHSYSQVAIHITKNPVLHEHTTHVELDCHFVRKQFLIGLISLHYLPSMSQLSDIFTKPFTIFPTITYLESWGFFTPFQLEGLGLGVEHDSPSSPVKEKHKNASTSSGS